jgi:vacuolar iron transporter family protein
MCDRPKSEEQLEMQSREEFGVSWRVPALNALARRVTDVGLFRRRCRNSASEETSTMPPRERHRTGRIGWLRAAVLGANDGIVSTASLVVGVAAAGTTRQDILLAGVAGMVAGALSMAAGEYVSVSSQADTERAELDLERAELAANRENEERELATIYVKRGVAPDLALTVAQQLMAHDALAAHARDELGLSEALAARPIQAALASAGMFAIGAGLPILTVTGAPYPHIVAVVSGVSLMCLAALGALSAQIGGAPAWLGTARMTFWGAAAMAATAAVGMLFGTSVT